MEKETFFISKDFQASLGFISVQEALSFSRGELVRNTPLRKTLWIRLEQGAGLFLKQYLAGKICPSFHRQKIHREKAAIEFLPRLGLSVPKLLGWGSRRNAGSFLLLQGCTGEPLDRVFAKGYPNPGGLTEYQAKKLWIESLAAFVGRLHAAGFVHRDLYLGHLLYEGFREGKPVLHLIDLQRVAKKRLRRWYVKDLAAMDFSAPQSISRVDRLRFLNSWLSLAAWKSTKKNWIQNVLRKSAKIAQHRPKYG